MLGFTRGDSFFMSLLTAPVVKNSRVLAEVSLSCLKNALVQTWNGFQIKFEPQWNGRETRYKVRQIIALSCKLVALTLS